MVNLRLNWFGKQQRLLFVVDDLDRCSPEAVVKVLEAVRLIMDLPNVAVLIAIDQKIALASLALRYRELAVHYGADPKLIARQYLGKVIHVSITLENPAPKAVEYYLRNRLWAADNPPDPPKPTEPTDPSKPLEPTDPSKPVDEDKKDKKPKPPEGNSSDKVADDPKEQKEQPRDKDEEAKTLGSIKAPDGKGEPPPPPIAIVKTPGLSEDQKNAFIHWANKFELANPRHIKRLDNAYNLIRMRYGDKDQAGKPDYRLVLLMWVEYCRELPLDTYAALKNYVRQEIAGEPEATVKELREAVDKYNRQVSAFWDDVKAVWKDQPDDPLSEENREDIEANYHRVRTFVLPAIERRIKSEK